MTAVVLHLSDIHIKTSRDQIIKKGHEIAATTFGSLHSASHVFIVCSGDIAFSGNTDEYEAARVLFSEIEEEIRKETKSPISFIFAPGNHDCDFSKDSNIRRMLIESIGRSDKLDVDGDLIDVCTAIQSDYFSFRNCLETHTTWSDDKLWRTSIFEVEGKKISFDCLNISWISKIREDIGKLFFPVERYSTQEFEQVDVRLLVMHHPFNWFNQSIYRPFRTFVRKLADIVITGHEHQGAVGLIEDAEAGESAYIEGCVLQHDSNNLRDSSFNVIVIDLGLGQFVSNRYVWNGKMYVASEEGSWSNYKNLPVKQSNPFSLLPTFQEQLDDPGAYFKHPSRVNISLSDIYIYPDLRKLGNGEDRRRAFQSARQLLSPEVTSGGILIEGDEKVGSTSLLFQLYRQYHERGFVPVYIKGNELKRVGDADIDRLIKHAVECQYGSDQIESFSQQPSKQKLLLLDDFDDSPIRAADARAELLCALRKRFGHFVVTVGNLFEMREMIEGDSSRALISLVHYQIQPFGHVRRSELISRWLSLSADGTVDEGEAIARLDQAEKLVNTVMQKSVIPSIPLYLLTLLQSMDAGRSGDFKESALGFYYQYLLTEAFQNSGVKSDKLTEHFQYAAHLAWEFHQQGKRELTELELRSFNERFTKVWHTVDFLPRLEVLLKARVLSKVGEDYAFRYPYIYYYLKGQYLSENLSDLAIRAYIIRCCQHLYVREYANTVLFLAHHSSEDFVLQSIAEALHNLFRGKAPVRFDGDTCAINKFIENAPKLTYSGEKPKEHRAHRNQFHDAIDDGHDGLLDKEEEAEQLSLIAQMTMLFKTTEILGQILKNQYSKIQRPRKRELLEELFNGPLRAIQDFYSFFEKNPDAFLVEIDAALQRKGIIEDSEERKTIARQVVAGLIQIITFGFLMRATQSANSESLREDIRDVVQKSGSTAFKLIELGINLDSPKPIPKGTLKSLFKDVKNDLVTNRVIRLMILNRLYMFKTSEQDMQWISQELSELDIKLETQHSITYQHTKHRRLSN